jgi:hypothetical protein
VPVEPVYIEQIFSTYLYTGIGSAQTITNDIDLSTKGGLVWIKGRNFAYKHVLTDTNRGVNSQLSSNTTGFEVNDTNCVTAFNTTGFSIGNNNFVNNGGVGSDSYVSWTFRKQPKFFTAISYTGNGTAGRTVSHNLGSTVGCMIIKRISSTSNWAVYHRSLGGTQAIQLNLTSAATTSSVYWNDTDPTSTVFTLGDDSSVNANGNTYIAYLYAHNAGGFGLTGTDNVISCGSFTANASGAATVNLGYEPQLILYKSATSVQDWYIYDTMRGWGQTTAMQLEPNLSAAEIQNASSPYFFFPTATGFQSTNDWFPASETFIYIAIRRGPMKVPTSGTSVFGAQTWTGNGASPRTFTSANWTFPPDLVTVKGTDNSAWWNQWSPRLTVGTLATNDTGAEQTASTSIAGYVSSFNQTGYTATSGSSSISNYNANADAYVSYNMRRAPSFMDVVCYTGTGSAQALTHNLTVVPELMIVKQRTAGTGPSWFVYSVSTGNTKYLVLNDTVAADIFSGIWNDTTPTSTQFTIGSYTSQSAQTYVAYLFATCAGVSKVGSYTGTGALQTINCGFTSGARFVMIKRTDSTGGWFYYDSVRGITSGNDPYLFFNSSNQQVTNTNFVDTDTTGFKVTATAPAEMNASGGTYIFLAIA